MLNALDKAIILWYDICKKSERGKNMDKIEKVIKGLEAHATGSGCMKNCPYWGIETINCSRELATDALALLKAQEPCEDAVSRKDVINVLQSPCDMRYVNGNWHPCIGDYIEAITNLSAVAPKAQEPVRVD